MLPETSTARISVASTASWALAPLQAANRMATISAPRRARAADRSEPLKPGAEIPKPGQAGFDKRDLLGQPGRERRLPGMVLGGKILEARELGLARRRQHIRLGAALVGRQQRQEAHLESDHEAVEIVERRAHRGGQQCPELASACI